MKLRKWLVNISSILFIQAFFLLNIYASIEEDYEFLVRFHEHQLNYAYQDFFRIYDLYRSSTFVHEVDIAATGFALAGLCIATERKLIDYDEAQEKALATIKRVLELQKSEKTSKFGFLYHFYIWNDGKDKFHPTRGAEISTIDTALLLAGIITAGEYFGGEVREKAEKVYANINWRAFYDSRLGRFHMAYKNNGFYGAWDFYTDEILLIAILAIGSPNEHYRVSPDEAMTGWRVSIGSYIPGEEYVYSWYGALFTYLYAHMFIDFRRLGRDRFHNIDWWYNSVYAIRADIAWCRNNGYPENVWGLTAAWSKESPNSNRMEYRWRIGGGLYGASDRFDNKRNGIWPVSTYAAASTIPFFDVPLKDNPGFKALKFMYPNMTDRTGLLIQSLDANNLDEDGRPKVNSNWMVGMDILTPPIMIENYLSGLVWNTFMRNENIKFALDSIF